MTIIKKSFKHPQSSEPAFQCGKISQISQPSPLQTIGKVTGPIQLDSDGNPELLYSNGEVCPSGGSYSTRITFLCDRDTPVSCSNCQIIIIFCWNFDSSLDFWIFCFCGRFWFKLCKKNRSIWIRIPDFNNKNTYLFPQSIPYLVMVDGCEYKVSWYTDRACVSSDPIPVLGCKVSDPDTRFLYDLTTLTLSQEYYQVSLVQYRDPLSGSYPRRRNFTLPAQIKLIFTNYFHSMEKLFGSLNSFGNHIYISCIYVEIFSIWWRSHSPLFCCKT